jgi:hypothetical protein
MEKLGWIAVIVATLVAVVGSFVTIPAAAAILIIAGFIAGLDVPEERQGPLLLATLVLLVAAGPLLATGAAGRIIAPIIANLGIAYMGASLTVILSALVGRLKP